ncbi:uncharacterized protein BDZ99DRAFT_521477 [Mytilinidion resinicola]|uniref:Uncharacterized protein n=1 Tax=Mytilinidion resinicola TaxID=574789 RepID=A0A6A6YKD5_9PEZI|nr:uncharacterized protein BDZ99DRAFT_521477 [Mytilinidion resinicola]KAF2809009.1 hypothetical protein BDZ99DRAFT_521477 [Mytilinidion resinicola]
MCLLTPQTFSCKHETQHLVRCEHFYPTRDGPRCHGINPPILPNEDVDLPCSKCKDRIRDLFRQAEEIDERALGLAVREHQTSIHARALFPPTDSRRRWLFQFAPINDAGNELLETLTRYHQDYTRANPDAFNPRNVPHFISTWTAKIVHMRLQISYDSHRISTIEHTQLKTLSDGTLPAMGPEDLEKRKWLFLEFLALNDWQMCQMFKGLTEDEIFHRVLP